MSLPTYAEIFRIAASSIAENTEKAKPPAWQPPARDDVLGDPDRWIVGLESALQTLAQSIAGAREDAGRRVVLAGARGSGKSLLLQLSARLAQASGIDGEIHSAREIEPPSTSGEARVEELARGWLKRRRSRELAFILIDDAGWTSLAAGRLHQLPAIFGNFPPAIVYALDFYNLSDLKRSAPGVYEGLEVVRLHPSTRSELHEIWERYFGLLNVDDSLLDDIIERSFGNPALLLSQGGSLVTEVGHRGASRLGQQLAHTIWRAGGYERALELRKQPQMQETRFDILTRVCQHGEVSATRLAQAFQWDRALCSYHLGKLEEDGLLYSSRAGASVVYSAHPPVRVVVETFLVMGYD